MIHWLRAVVLSIIAGELTLFLFGKYLPSFSANHFAFIIIAFVMMYIMAPRVPDIKAQNNNSFSIHLVDPITKTIGKNEVPKENLKQGDMIFLRDRVTGGGYHLDSSTPVFVVNKPAVGDFVYGVPYLAREIIL